MARTCAQPDPLAARLTEVFTAAYRRYRKGQRGFGALVTVPVPPALIDEVAVGFAPVLRELITAAVAEQLDPPAPVRPALAPTDLR